MARTWLVAVAAIGVLAATWVLGSPKAPADGGPLASHRAVYDLKLGRTTQKSHINGARGRLVVEWEAKCDGFITNQRLYTEFLTDEGGATVSDIWLSSWEARDGSLFRFTLTSMTNGEVDEKVTGEARPGAKISPTTPGTKASPVAGEAVYTEPAGNRISLPAGVLFPTAHMIALIDAARNGQRTIERPVFDGSRKNGLSDVGAFIGPVQGPGEEKEARTVKNASRLLAGRSWPVRLAFFAPTKVDNAPDYEFAYRMYENGVATGLVFDYGDFVVNGTLSKIEPLTGCDSPQPQTTSTAKSKP